MSTIVCQNVVSCFESQLTETTATLKLRVAAPPQPQPATLDFCKKQETDDHRPSEVKMNLEFGNWGTLLQTTPKESVEKGKSFYTHPLARKSSFSKLSPKSLELCTENLGSETGTDIVTGSSTAIFSSSSSSSTSPSFYLSDSSENSSPLRRVELEKSKQETKSPRKPHHEEAKSDRKIKNFPPPLTTISGSRSLQVRRHREGGRLIIEAVEAPSRSSCLQAERSDGRLKLCLLTSSDSEVTIASAGGEEIENGDECGGEIAVEEEIDEPRGEVEAEKEEFDGEINLDMGIEKFQRLSRCKERGPGNRGLSSDWKPALWVATS